MSNSALQYYKITNIVQRCIYSKITFKETNRMQFCQIPPVSFRKICCSFESLVDINFQA